MKRGGLCSSGCSSKRHGIAGPVDPGVRCARHALVDADAPGLIHSWAGPAGDAEFRQETIQRDPFGVPVALVFVGTLSAGLPVGRGGTGFLLRGLGMRRLYTEAGRKSSCEDGVRWAPGGLNSRRLHVMKCR